MKTIKLTWILLLLAITFAFITGCEVGVNPLLFDGTPIEATFTVTTTGTSWDAGTTTVDLNDVFENIKKFADSVRVFNITVRVEDLGGTSPSTTISGTASFNGTTVVTLNTIQISSVSAEKSIFNSGGVLTPNPAGVNALLLAIKNAASDLSTAHPATFGASGGSSGGLNVKVHLKIYTQVWTTP